MQQNRTFHQCQTRRATVLPLSFDPVPVLVTDIVNSAWTAILTQRYLRQNRLPAICILAFCSSTSVKTGDGSPANAPAALLATSDFLARRSGGINLYVSSEDGNLHYNTRNTNQSRHLSGARNRKRKTRAGRSALGTVRAYSWLASAWSCLDWRQISESAPVWILTRGCRFAKKTGCEQCTSRWLETKSIAASGKV